MARILSGIVLSFALGMLAPSLWADTLEDACAAYDQGRFVEARDLASNFIAENSGHSEAPRAQFVIADSDFMLGDFAAFQQAVQAYQTQYPDQTSNTQTLLFHQALIPLNQSKLDESIASLRKFVDDYPGSGYEAEARGNLLLIYSSNRLKPEFEAELHAFTSRFPHESAMIEKFTYFGAMLEYNLGNWEAAEIALSQFVETHPQSPQRIDADFHRIWSMGHAGDTTRFLSEIETFRTSYPEAISHIDTFNFLKAMIPYQNGELERALTDLKAFSEQNPTSPHAIEADFYYLWSLYSNNLLEDFLTAEQAFQMHYPEQTVFIADLAFAKSMIAFRNRQWEDSINALSAFLQDQPDYKNLLEVKYWLTLSKYELAVSEHEGDALAQSSELLRDAAFAITVFREDCDTELRRQDLDSRKRYAIELFLLHLEHRCGEYDKIVVQSEAQLDRYAPHSLQWMESMLWKGIGYAMASSPDFEQSRIAFEEVINSTNATPPADAVRASTIQWLIRNPAIHPDAAKMEQLKTTLLSLAESHNKQTTAKDMNLLQ